IRLAIHVPLSAEAQAEARILMLSANNLVASSGLAALLPFLPRIWFWAPTT
ncbi:hypothetical protein EVA_15136, partial [gut metagenome]